MTTLSKLNQYGTVFQLKVIGALVSRRDFLLNISDSLDSDYFESSSYKWIIDYIKNSNSRCKMKYIVSIRNKRIH